MALYTDIEYLYRDYSNYKFYGTFTIVGEVKFSQISKHLYEGKKFVPREVGVAALTPKEMNEDDHWLHELVSCRISEQPAATPLMKSSDFLKRLSSCNDTGWLLLCPRV